MIPYIPADREKDAPLWEENKDKIVKPDHTKKKKEQSTIEGQISFGDEINNIESE